MGFMAVVWIKIPYIFLLWAISKHMTGRSLRFHIYATHKFVLLNTVVFTIQLRILLFWSIMVSKESHTLCKFGAF
jgi:hypothetical protein